MQKNNVLYTKTVMKIKRLIKPVIPCLFLTLMGTLRAQDKPPFMHPPRIIEQPSGSLYETGSRNFTGIPSLAVTDRGTFWAVWYTGVTPAEDENNYVVVSSSRDEGRTWKEILIIDPDGSGPVRAFDPEVWIDPNGKLWVFWAQAIGHDGNVAGVWSVTTSELDSGSPAWTEPRRLTDGVMMCKLTVLSTGEWILPASTWKETEFSARFIVSKDQGKNWSIRGAVNVPEKERDFDEHMIVEKKDSTLWMLVRTRYGIGESLSSDRGRTWSPLLPSGIKHPNARFFIRRLASGNLLLVKHGPVKMKTGRSHLMAFISVDDGATWSKGLLLDAREGVSYPDGQQGKDGNIYIIYDHQRTRDQEIVMTSFTEEDILADDHDKRIIKVNRHRRIVSKGGP